MEPKKRTNLIIGLVIVVVIAVTAGLSLDFIGQGNKTVKELQGLVLPKVGERGV